MVSKAQLLQVLPPFTNSSLLIEDDQDVSGIIREVVNAHKCFSGDYDLIYDFFLRPDIYDTCKALFDFCKANIRYIVEGEDAQTTKSPSALLVMGFGDCKHYAGFIAGVLSAIVRNTGEKIKWMYRFTGYDYFSSEPGHVFVVVNDGDDEIWIDPVLKTFDERLKPVIIVDKKVNDMALLRVSGVEELEFTETLQNMDIVPDLAYSTDDQDAGLSPELVAAIHLLLYYEVLDLAGNIDDFRLLSLQNQLSDQEFQNLVNARQFINTATVSGLFSSIFRGIKKVTLAAPRAAYLSVVALNVFGTATKLKQATTTQDGINKVRDVWYKLGGDWAKLRDAISNGSKRKRILGIGVAPALPAWVVTASAIIAAMTPIITSILKQQQDQGLLGNDFDPSLLNPDPYSGLDGDGKTPVQDFIREYGAWIAVGGLGLYLYFNGRKKRRA